VAGATGVARQVADLTPWSSVSRIAAAQDLGSLALLDRMYATGPVALMLDARPSIPPAITKVDESGRARVLVVGQTRSSSHDNPYQVTRKGTHSSVNEWNL
jgi:hypothetical protein